MYTSIPRCVNDARLQIRPTGQPLARGALLGTHSCCCQGLWRRA